ncbi:TPA: hypothetical protein ACH3X2_000890 [Trebouxia sp. C0005]
MWGALAVLESADKCFMTYLILTHPAFRLIQSEVGQTVRSSVQRHTLLFTNTPVLLNAGLTTPQRLALLAFFTVVESADKCFMTYLILTHPAFRLIRSEVG